MRVLDSRTDLTAAAFSCYSALLLCYLADPLGSRQSAALFCGVSLLGMQACLL